MPWRGGGIEHASIRDRLAGERHGDESAGCRGTRMVRQENRAIRLSRQGGEFL
jgi:hypothetical protein